MNQGMVRACEIAGSQRALAEKLGVSDAMVSQWVLGHRPVALAHCLSIEELTGVPVREIQSEIADALDRAGYVRQGGTPTPEAA